MSFLTDLIQSLPRLKSWLVRPTPTPVVPPKPTPAPVPPPIPMPPPDLAAGLLEAHNAIRASRDVPPLRANARLLSAAQVHAALMATKGMMSHQFPGEPRFDQRISSTGYRWSRAAENIAMGQRSVANVMKAWENSPGHMANIVGPCSEMGGAVAVDDDGRTYWSVSFAGPAGPFGVAEGARPMVTTVLGVGGTTSSIQIGPQGEETP